MGDDEVVEAEGSGNDEEGGKGGKEPCSQEKLSAEVGAEDDGREGCGYGCCDRHVLEGRRDRVGRGGRHGIGAEPGAAQGQGADLEVFMWKGEAREERERRARDICPRRGGMVTCRIAQGRKVRTPRIGTCPRHSFVLEASGNQLSALHHFSLLWNFCPPGVVSGGAFALDILAASKIPTVKSYPLTQHGTCHEDRGNLHRII